jgi:hypothetical protein
MGCLPSSVFFIIGPSPEKKTIKTWEARPTILVSSMRMEGDNGLLFKVKKLLP